MDQETFFTSRKDKADKHISTGFKLSEFSCRCFNDECDCVSIKKTLIQALETFRTFLANRFNRKIVMTVLSGNRCKKHNKEVGGTNGSRHMHFDACDLGLNVPITEEVIDEAKRLFDGVGWYPKKKFLHLDMRGIKTTWVL